MKNKHRARTTNPTLSIETVTNEYGLPEPSIRIELSPETHWRFVKAGMHLVAARVELLSVAERWCVQTRTNDSYDYMGRVYLELADGTPAECERGLAVLRAVVAQDFAALPAICTGV